MDGTVGSLPWHGTWKEPGPGSPLRGAPPRLRTLRVRIAMEDFGTGHSSLSFPSGKAKIDRSFVQELETRQDDAAIVQAVTEPCARLGLSTAAEGVETTGQLRRLAEEHCAGAQG